MSTALITSSSKLGAISTSIPSQPAGMQPNASAYVMSTMQSAAPAQKIGFELERLELDAYAGDPKAQTQLGIKYYTGSPNEGLAQSYNKAYTWWEKAAKQGFTDAEYALGQLFKNGLGVPQDYVKAREWFRKAAAAGYAKALHALGVFYAEGLGIAKDLAKAREYFAAAAEQGHKGARTALASLTSPAESHTVSQSAPVSTNALTSIAVSGQVQPASAQTDVNLLIRKLRLMRAEFRPGLIGGAEKAIKNAIPRKPRIANKRHKAHSMKFSHVASHALDTRLTSKAVSGKSQPANVQANASLPLGQNPTNSVSKVSSATSSSISPQLMAKTLQDARARKANAQYQLGMKYYKGAPNEGVAQDYKKARELFEEAANGGIANAAFELARLLEEGLGGTIDYESSRKWDEKAALQGHVDAQYSLGIFYRDGLGVARDYKKADEYFEAAAAKGDERSMNELGNFYSAGLGVAQDYKKARGYYELAAGKGSMRAKYNLANLYKHALGVPKDYKRAHELYEEAGNGGIADGLCCLGWLYWEGSGVERDYKKAREYFEAGASKGSAGAKYGLAHLYEHALGVPQDYKKARELHEEAAKEGYTFALKLLGNFYYSGVGVAQDHKKANEYWKAAALKEQYEAAAAKEDACSLNTVADFYRDGLGVVVQDYEKARELYEEAAKKGYADALNGLGFIHENGLGVTRDYKKAREYYEEGASKGSVVAKGNLARLYENELGVLRDYKKARELYEEAANEGYAKNAKYEDDALFGRVFGSGSVDTIHIAQYYKKALELYTEAAQGGDADALNRLGNFFSDGLGVVKDYEKACEYYKTGANKGSPAAKYNLARLHEYALGVPKDLQRACELYEAAAAQGDELAHTALARLKAPSAPPLPIMPQPAASTAQALKMPAAEHIPPIIPKPIDTQKKPAEAESQTLLLKQQQELVDRCKGLEASIIQSQKKVAELQQHAGSSNGVNLSGLINGNESALVSVLDREALHLQALKERQKILENDKAGDFYFVFQNTFNKVIAACMVIDTKMLGGAQASLATEKSDMVLDFTGSLGQLSQSIPGVGLILQILNGPLKGYNSLEKARAVKHVAMLFTGALSYEPIGEMVARGVTIEKINEIEALNTTKAGFFKRQVENYSKLQDKLLKNEEVDTKLRLFAEEQCQILLLAFMKKEVTYRPEPKDVPALVALVLKKNPAVMELPSSLGLGLQPTELAELPHILQSPQLSH